MLSYMKQLFSIGILSFNDYNSLIMSFSDISITSNPSKLINADQPLPLSDAAIARWMQQRVHLSEGHGTMVYEELLRDLTAGASCAIYLSPVLQMLEQPWIDEVTAGQFPLKVDQENQIETLICMTEMPPQSHFSSGTLQGQNDEGLTPTFKIVVGEAEQLFTCQGPLLDLAPWLSGKQVGGNRRDAKRHSA